MNKGEKMHAPTKEQVYHDKNTYKHKLEQAEHELELLRNPWISVDDKLPINNANEMKFNYETLDVIVLSGGLVGVCEFAAGKTIDFWCEFQDKDVTHWMALPSAPTIKDRV